jgi:prolipoprotein diacylglyceryltransferase
MKYAIECFAVAAFILVVFVLSYFIIKPFVERTDDPAKKKLFFIFKIIFIIVCINSIYLIVLGIYFLLYARGTYPAL